MLATAVAALLAALTIPQLPMMIDSIKNLDRGSFYYCPSPAEKLELRRQGYRVQGCKITPRRHTTLPELREKSRDGNRNKNHPE